jgi:hypothetical protein
LKLGERYRLHVKGVGIDGCSSVEGIYDGVLASNNVEIKLLQYTTTAQPCLPPLVESNENPELKVNVYLPIQAFSTTDKVSVRIVNGLDIAANQGSEDYSQVGELFEATIESLLAGSGASPWTFTTKRLTLHANYLLILNGVSADKCHQLTAKLDRRLVHDVVDVVNFPLTSSVPLTAECQDLAE